MTPKDDEREEDDEPDRSAAGPGLRWVVDERLRDRVDRAGVESAGVEAGGLGSAARPSTGWRRMSPVAGVTVGLVALVIGVLGADQFGVWPGRTGAGGPAGAPASASRSAPPGTVQRTSQGSQLPTPGWEEQPGRVRPAVEMPAGAATGAGARWRPLETQSGGAGSTSPVPVRWNPCRPVRYVVRPDGAPPGGAALIADSFRQLSVATGLAFVPDGTIDESPVTGRQPFQPHRYGDRWAPVLVAWVSPAELAGRRDGPWGRAAPVPVAVRGRPSVYVTGVVELDAAQFGARLASGRGEPAARVGMLHLLGHLAGLDHVPDPEQLMAAPAAAGSTRPADRTGYAPGDLVGLATLGRGLCAPWL